MPRIPHLTPFSALLTAGVAVVSPSLFETTAEGETGQKALVEKTTSDFAAHLADQRNPALCIARAARIRALSVSQ